MNETLTKIIKKWLVFAVIILIFTVTGLIITRLSPKEYEAKSTLLVTQPSPESFDAYIALRSADRVAYSLSQVIGSSAFQQEVFAADQTLDQNWLPKDQETKIKMWQKKITARAVKEAGILEVSVFHENPQEAYKISQAINFVLMHKSADYHGGGEIVKIKVINAPQLPTEIARPNVLINVGGGAVVGLLVGLAYLVLTNFETTGASTTPSSPVKSIAPKNQKPLEVKDNNFFQPANTLPENNTKLASQNLKSDNIVTNYLF